MGLGRVRRGRKWFCLWQDFNKIVTDICIRKCGRLFSVAHVRREAEVQSEGPGAHHLHVSPVYSGHTVHRWLRRPTFQPPGN